MGATPDLLRDDYAPSPTDLGVNRAPVSGLACDYARIAIALRSLDGNDARWRASTHACLHAHAR